MSVRSWLIRGAILAGVAVLVALGWVASSWVSPERVREKVLAHLHEQFDGVDIHVGSARMRILGGIAVTDIRIVRTGDPPERAFLSVPSAVLYHDKEQLNHGRLVIRKVELENPELHLERSPDGRWTLGDLIRPGPADKPVPTFVARGGTVTITDRSPAGIPPVRLTDARFTLLNDPLPVLSLDAHAAAAGLGPVHLRGRMNRITRHVGLGLELAELPVGAAAVTLAERYAPALAPHLAKLTGTAAILADLNYTPEATPAWRHDVRVELKDGRFTHPDLPWAVEKLALKASSVDGRVKVQEATARFGAAVVKFSLESRADLLSAAPKAVTPADADPLHRFEDHLQRLDVSVGGVPLDGPFFEQLPVEKVQRARRMFSPAGAVDVAYRFTREAAGWRREFELRPQQTAIKYEKFPYPVTDVRGWVKRTVTHTGDDDTRIDLVGTAGGQPITIKGQVYGDGEDPFIDLRIAGNNVPIDERLFSALPGKYPAMVRQLGATGRGDFVAEIKQRLGENLCENEFRLEVRDGTMHYAHFPYKLEKVKGMMVARIAASSPDRPVRPGGPRHAPTDRDEVVLREFTATHAGGVVWLNGCKRSIPGTTDRRLELQIGGNNCAIDEELRTALKGLKLDTMWNALAPRGTLTFSAVVDVLDRGPTAARPEFDPPFDPATDLKLGFQFYGPTVTPAFFPYEMTDLSGVVKYENGQVNLDHFAARHGTSRLKLGPGEVRFYPSGVVWANLAGIEVRNLVADPDLLRALPGKLRSGVEELKLKGGAELVVNRLVVLTPPDPPTNALPPPEPLPIGPVSVRGFPSGGREPPEPAGTSPKAPAALRGLTPPARLIPVFRAQAPEPLPTPDPVVYWDAELKLAGASIEAGVTWEELYGRVGSKGRYEGTHTGLVVGNVWLDRAVVAKQPVTSARIRARSEPQKPDPTRPGYFLPSEVQFLDLSGDLFDGTLGGEARVVLAEPTRYDLWLTATDVQLDKLARHYNLGSDADLKGLAQAQVRLYSRLDPRTGKFGVEGSGRLDVPTGRMYNLPILLDLMKLAKGQAPDKTAFEEAHATFRVHGDRVKVDQLDLIGKAVCLGGSGELSSSGEYVKFEFYTLGSQILAKLVNTPVGDVSAFLSRNLFLKIKLTRENGELKYRAEAVPLVTEPTKAVIERLRNAAGRVMGR
jgi:hypothetical protein